MVHHNLFMITSGSLVIIHDLSIAMTDFALPNWSKSSDHLWSMVFISTQSSHNDHRRHENHGECCSKHIIRFTPDTFNSRQMAVQHSPRARNNSEGTRPARYGTPYSTTIHTKTP